MQKLNAGHEDIISESIKVSLKCPITMALITIPVRGINCKHISCFNLETFVNMQRKSKINRWRCPICQELAIHVVLDKFFMVILEDAKRYMNAHQVEVYTNGSFKIIELNDMEDASEESKETDRRRPREHSEDEDLPRKKFNGDTRSLNESLTKAAVENTNAPVFSLITQSTSLETPSREESRLPENQFSLSNLQSMATNQVGGTSQCPICID